jgi:Tol biopolymer transport system component
MTRIPRRRLAAPAILVLALVGLTAAPASATSPGDASTDLSAQPLQVLSVTPDGQVGDHSSERPVVSTDGRTVAFTSRATNLVDGLDPDLDRYQSYVRDRDAGVTELISRTPEGEPGNNASWMNDISADGRYVVFSSMATDLTSDADTGFSDIFRYDRVADEITQVSVSVDGSPTDGDSDFGSISADGQVVVFYSNASNLVERGTADFDLYVRDLASGETRVVAVGLDGEAADGRSFYSEISDNGRYVAFESGATNLVPDDTNSKPDIFRRDLQTDEIVAVSVDPTGGVADESSGKPTISADGNLIAFESDADSLVKRDRNGRSDVFVRDVDAGQTMLISCTPTGRSGRGTSFQASITPDGQIVSFVTSAHSLVDEPFRKLGIVSHTSAANVLVAAIKGSPDNWLHPKPSQNGVIVFGVRTPLLDVDDNGARDVYLRRM